MLLICRIGNNNNPSLLDSFCNGELLLGRNFILSGLSGQSLDARGRNDLPHYALHEVLHITGHVRGVGGATIAFVSVAGVEPHSKIWNTGIQLEDFGHRLAGP